MIRDIHTITGILVLSLLVLSACAWQPPIDAPPMTDQEVRDLVTPTLYIGLYDADTMAVALQTCYDLAIVGHPDQLPYTELLGATGVTVFDPKAPYSRFCPDTNCTVCVRVGHDVHRFTLPVQEVIRHDYAVNTTGENRYDCHFESALKVSNVTYDDLRNYTCDTITPHPTCDATRYIRSPPDWCPP